MVRGVEIMDGQVVANDGLGHEWLLSLAQLADHVMDALEAVDAGLDPASLLAEQPQPLRWVVCGEDGADRLERHLEIPKAADGTSRVELIAAIAPVARESIDLGRRE